MYYVYILKHPDTLQPFYVGKGTGNRMMVHEKNYHTLRERKSNPLKTSTIKAIKDAGLHIVYEQIDCTSESDAIALEIQLIEQYGRKCYGTGILTNICPGGEGGKPGVIVHQYNLDGKFVQTINSTKEAAQLHGVSVSAIQSAANPTTSIKSAGGFLWSYEKVDALPAWQHDLHIQVDQYDKRGNLLASYDTVSAAGEATGVDAGNISACCSKTLKTAGKFVWRYKGEEFGLATHKASRRVQQFDKATGEFISEFASVKEAGERCAIESSNISRCCTGKIKSAGGYVWKYPE